MQIPWKNCRNREKDEEADHCYETISLTHSSYILKLLVRIPTEGRLVVESDDNGGRPKYRRKF